MPCETTIAFAVSIWTFTQSVSSLSSQFPLSAIWLTVSESPICRTPYLPPSIVLPLMNTPEVGNPPDGYACFSIRMPSPLWIWFSSIFQALLACVAEPLPSVSTMPAPPESIRPMRWICERVIEDVRHPRT